MDHSDWEAVASVLVLQKMESRQITGASSLPAMLLLSTPAADLASLAKVLVVFTNRAWKNEAFLRQLVSAPAVAQIKVAVLAHRLFQDLVTSVAQSSEFTPCAAITAIRTLFFGDYDCPRAAGQGDTGG